MRHRRLQFRTNASEDLPVPGYGTLDTTCTDTAMSISVSLRVHTCDRWRDYFWKPTIVHHRYFDSGTFARTADNCASTGLTVPRKSALDTACADTATLTSVSLDALMCTISGNHSSCTHTADKMKSRTYRRKYWLLIHAGLLHSFGLERSPRAYVKAL